MISTFANYGREELIEEIEYLRREIGHIDKITDISETRTALGLTMQQARLLLSLYAANGRLLSDIHLLEVIDSAAENPVLIRVIVSSIRRRLGKTAIQSERGRLFRLTPEGRAIVDKARMECEA